MRKTPGSSSLTIVHQRWQPASLFEVFDIFIRLRKAMWAAGYDKFEIGEDAYCKGAYGIRAYPKIELPFDHGGPWPPVWGIVKRLGLGRGCGSGHSHQIYAHPFLNGWHYRHADETDGPICRCGREGKPRVHHFVDAGIHCDQCWQDLVDDYNSRCW